MKFKDIIIYALALLFITFTIIAYCYYKENLKLKESLEISINNEKAFIRENDVLKNNNIQYKLTIEQLGYLNDSLSIRLGNMKKQLKIKDSDIKNLQYLLSKAVIKDSIFIRDTIFRDPKFEIDTSMVNKWYSINLKMKYPNSIYIEPSITSEKYIITHSKEETIDKPYKCWFFRLFQKKHIVVEVEVIDNNPYIKSVNQRFIEIID